MSPYNVKGRENASDQKIFQEGLGKGAGWGVYGLVRHIKAQLEFGFSIALPKFTRER